MFPLILACLSVGLVSQVLEFLNTGLSAVFSNTAATIVLVIEFAAGIYKAKKGCIAEHKVCRSPPDLVHLPCTLHPSRRI